MRYIIGVAARSAADTAQADPKADYGNEAHRHYPPSREQPGIATVFAVFKFVEVILNSDRKQPSLKLSSEESPVMQCDHVLKVHL